MKIAYCKSRILIIIALIWLLNSGTLAAQSDKTFQSATSGVVYNLTYGTYLGGNEEDVAMSVVVDDSNYAYITGFSQSENFPVTKRFGDSTTALIPRAFIAKINLNNNQLIFSTIISGGSLEVGYNMFVDDSGNVTVSGKTLSTSLLGELNSGLEDGFLIKLNSDGTQILHLELIDGPGSDVPWGMTRDQHGNFYATGHTGSNLDGQVNNGDDDIFLIKWDQNLNKVYTRLFGGNDEDWGRDISVAPSGNIYITGWSRSDFGGQTNNGDLDIFLVKCDSNGTLVYTRMLGGPDVDFSQALTVDSDENIWVAGYTHNDLDGNILNGLSDVVLAKWDLTGNKIFTKTFKGMGDNRAYDVITDANNSAYIAGTTDSPDFPQVFSFQNSYNGGFDAFITKVSADGNQIVSSNYHGGSGLDRIMRLYFRNENELFAAGFTTSTDMTTVNPFQGNNAGTSDAMIIRIEPNDTCCAGPRGDFNGDWSNGNILDLTFLIDYIFRGSGNPGPCTEEDDPNGDGVSSNVLDLTYLVDFIFRSGAEPVNCP